MAVDASNNEEIEYSGDEELEDLEALMKEADEEYSEEEPEEQEEDNQEENQEPEGEPDEAKPEEEEENPDDEKPAEDNPEEEPAEEDTGFKPVTLEVGGQKIEITSQEELLAFANKGAENFGKEEKQPTIEEQIVEQGKLSQDDLKLLIDAKNGNPQAIAKLAEMGGVSDLDIPAESDPNYKPEFDVKQVSELDKVAETIVSNPDLHNKFKQVAGGLPDSFMQEIYSHANNLREFKSHIESGLAQQVIPDAIKLSYQGMDFKQAYIQTALKISQGQQNQQQAPQKQERVVDDRAKQLREKANEPRSRNQGNKNGDFSEDDIWNMSQEDFDALVDAGGH